MSDEAREKISVVIPSYDSEKTIRTCVQKVLDTGYRPLEVIVVDDASGDGSAAIVAEMARENPDLITLLRLQRNGGPGRARNIGARASEGRYVFFVDSDTAVLPDALDNFARAILDCDVVSGIYHWEPLNDEPVAWYKSLLNYQLFSRKGAIDYELINPAVSGIRREVFESTGGYDESLAWGMDYEGEEFSLRLIEKHRILLDPSVAVRHHFPGFLNMTRTYFARVSLWMELFLRHKTFDSGGPATAGVGFATVCLPAAFASLPLLLLSHWAALVPLFFFVSYIRGYGGFFALVSKKRPSFLAPALLLNWWFCGVLSAAAANGALRVLAGKGRVR